MQQVLKMQQISWFPKHKKLISRGFFFTCIHVRRSFKGQLLNSYPANKIIHQLSWHHALEDLNFCVSQS